MATPYNIVSWINDYLDQSGLDSLVVGTSGGVDSALVSTLCTLTKRTTILVSMPIHQSKEQLSRARNHINWLATNNQNVTPYEVDLTSLFENTKSLFGNSSDLTLANTRSRLRMVALYHIAGINRGLVVGTGNKVEDFGIGFFTKYGDGGVDISPIADLKKSQVRKMAQELGVSEEIVNAAPTDGLWSDDRTDEDQIGASYEELEWAMDYEDNSVPNNLTERQQLVLSIYRKLNLQNQHKMNPIPIYKYDT